MFHYSITQGPDQNHLIEQFPNELKHFPNEGWQRIKSTAINFYDNLYQHLDFIKSVIKRSHKIIPALNNIIYSCLYASWTLTAYSLQSTTYGLLFRSGFDIARAFDRLVLLPINWGVKVSSLGMLERANLTLDLLQALTEVAGVILRSIDTFTNGFQLAAVAATPFVIAASAMGIAGSAAFMLNASLTSLVYGLYLYDKQALPGQKAGHSRDNDPDGASSYAVHDRVPHVFDAVKAGTGLSTIFNEIDTNINEDLDRARRTFYYEMAKTGLSFLFLAGSVSMLLSLAAPTLPGTLVVSFAFSAAAAVGYLAFTMLKSYYDIYYDDSKNEQKALAVKTEFDTGFNHVDEYDCYSDDFEEMAQEKGRSSIMSSLNMTLFGKSEPVSAYRDIEMNDYTPSISNDSSA